MDDSLRKQLRTMLALANLRLDAAIEDETYYRQLKNRAYEDIQLHTKRIRELETMLDQGEPS